jgi:hypothetical protein
MLSTARLIGQTFGAMLVTLTFAGGGHDATRRTLLLAAGFSLFGLVVSGSRLLWRGQGKRPKPGRTQ